MQVGNSALDDVKFHVNDYKYDELNRLTAVKYGVKDATNKYNLLTNSYSEDFSYDANGNFLTAKRYDYSTGTPTMIDDFTYTYQTAPQPSTGICTGSSYKPTSNNSKCASNKLSSLSDNGTDVIGYTDIKKTSTNPNVYLYDAIGNLVVDTKEGLGTNVVDLNNKPTNPGIDWNVAGKVEKISKTVGGLVTNYFYYYDAMGNRVAKNTQVVSTGVNTWEYYVRDAKGNPMANYSRTITGSNTTVTTTEQPIYGSARIGVSAKPITYFNNTSTVLAAQLYPTQPTSTNYGYRVVGDKRYELTDHLGNSRNIITNMRLSSRAGTSSPNYVFNTFRTEDQAIYNYYAFGMPKTSAYDYAESTPSLTYKYGFNGQQKVDEIAGIGNHNTALFWEYDTRLGRRWNKDPVIKCDLSRYAVFSNSPVCRIDPNGDDDFFTKEGKLLYSVSVDPERNKIQIINCTENELKEAISFANIKFNGNRNQVNAYLRAYSDLINSFQILDNSNNYTQNAEMIKNVITYYTAQYYQFLATLNFTKSEDFYAETTHNLTHGETTIGLTTSGYFREELSYVGNLISLVKHENFHANGMPASPQYYKEHIFAYYAEISSPDFNKTTLSFQAHTFKSAEHFYNTYQLFDNSNGKLVEETMHKIKSLKASFEKNNTKPHRDNFKPGGRAAGGGRYHKYK